ncbi:MAG: hypothetical protein M3Q98_08275 [Actinomycetota bacterium]|nr:hypothetical protein [Actinomycetota bacterium]
MRVLCALAVAVCLIAAGCGGANTTTSPAAKPAATAAVHAGDCIAKEIHDLDDVAPDFNTGVDCRKPHVYEVSDVINVPKRFLRGKTSKAKLANRKVLGSVDEASQLTDEFGEFADTECGPAALKNAGMGRLRIGGKSLKEAGAELVMGGAEPWINLSSPADWINGREKVICSVRFTKHLTDEGVDVAPEPISAKTGHPAFHDFLTEDFPAVRRQCVTYDSQDRYGLSPCTKHHYGEIFFSYDAAAVFGQKFVQNMDIDDPNDAGWEKLGDPCFDGLPALIGSDLDGDLSGAADLGTQGWYEDSPVFTTYCVAVPYESEDFDLPAGSLVENSANVDFVRISKGQGA